MTIQILGSFRHISNVNQEEKVPMHHQLTMPALRAKKDVLVEWPLGANTAQAEELAALAKSQNVRTVVALQARTSPLVQKVCEGLPQHLTKPQSH